MERNEYIMVTGENFNFLYLKNIKHHHQLSLIEHKLCAEHYAMH